VSVSPRAGAGRGQRSWPGHFAGRLAYGEHTAIERDGDDFILPQRDAPVIHAAACDIACPGAIGTGVHFPFDGAALCG
jgi:hypothetical protein